jgi:sarcosine oxidase subunit delta
MLEVLRILCPYCGVCDEDEFLIDKVSLVVRPALNVAHATKKRDLVKPKAVAGIQVERWGHLYGCGRWFNVARDSRTREIVQTYAIGLAPPDPADI